jgi:hypothetical protein
MLTRSLVRVQDKAQLFPIRHPRPDTLYRRALRRFSRYAFPVCERLGFHIVPIHYYQPIPDSRTLTPALSERTSQMIGIDLRPDSQIELLARFESAYKAEYDSIPMHSSGDRRQFYIQNNRFSTVDAEILYCMIRYFRPRLMIEIGGGMSTLLSVQALSRNRTEGADSELITIEPYPDEVLVSGLPGFFKLCRTEVQQVPLSLFERLDAGDILFIDSSHICAINSDVNYEFLEILPRVKPGVVIHIHDIYLPREYDVAFFKKHKVFLNEQYLLQAFLTYNTQFEILWAGNYMHINHPDLLRTAFRSYHAKPATPLSWWIRRKLTN